MNPNATDMKSICEVLHLYTYRCVSTAKRGLIHPQITKLGYGSDVAAFRRGPMRSLFQ